MVITALDHVPHCYSSADGDIIAGLIRSGLATGTRVTLSLTGVSDIPSSFVNAAFVSLLDTYDYDHIKANLTIADASKQAADMVRRCFRIATRQDQVA